MTVVPEMNREISNGQDKTVLFLYPENGTTVRFRIVQGAKKVIILKLTESITTA